MAPQGPPDLRWVERGQSKAEFKQYHFQWIISSKKQTGITCTKSGIMGIICLICHAQYYLIISGATFQHCQTENVFYFPTEEWSAAFTHVDNQVCYDTRKKKKTKQLSCPVISLRKVPKNGIVRSKDSNFKTSFTNFTNWASVQWSYVTFQTLCWAPGLQRHPVVLDQAHFPHILANSEYCDALSILAFYVKMVVYSQWLKI